MLNIYPFSIYVVQMMYLNWNVKRTKMNKKTPG